MYKKQNPGSYQLTCKPNLFLLTFLVLLSLIISSCSISKCTLCDIDNRTVYHVELNKGKFLESDKEKLISFFPPIPVEVAGGKVKVYVVDCEGKEPYRLPKGKQIQQFVNNNLIIIDSLDIKRISKTSDADIYPEVDYVQKLIDDNKQIICQRVRSRNKTEIRMMVGLRSIQPSSYEPIPGDFQLEKPVLGYDQEGTMITYGHEVAFLPAILTVNNKHRLNLGIMSGYWPVDGGNYIPVSIHPRFTFNDITNPLRGNCNTYYLFGDLGTAYDLSGQSDKFWSNKLNSWFWDLGGGIDWKLTKKMDFSFDLGFRQTTLALPSIIENSDWLNCIQNHGIAWTGYPRRRAGQLFIRLGITF